MRTATALEKSPEMPTIVQISSPITSINKCTAQYHLFTGWIRDVSHHPKSENITVKCDGKFEFEAHICIGTCIHGVLILFFTSAPNTFHPSRFSRITLTPQAPGSGTCSSFSLSPSTYALRPAFASRSRVFSAASPAAFDAPAKSAPLVLASVSVNAASGSTSVREGGRARVYV